MKATGLKHAAIAAVCLLLGIVWAGLDVRLAHAGCCGGGGMSGGGGGMSEEEKAKKEAKELPSETIIKKGGRNGEDVVLPLEYIDGVPVYIKEVELGWKSQPEKKK